MSPSDTSDDYVTFGIFFPADQTGYLPTLDPYSLPVWFPDPDNFFPKGAQTTYAIRNKTGATSVLAPDGSSVSIPSPGWWLYINGLYQYVEDPYFSGGIADASGGTQYPAAGLQNLPINPPQWVIDGTDPTPAPADPGTGPGWQQQPDPGGGGITPADDTTDTTTPEETP